jgi:16S rRNA (uracil1498-N3)-methyltransferase
MVMRLHRFFVEENLEGEKEIIISDSAIIHQIKDVFRLEKGDEVILFDGRGVDYKCQIVLLSKDEGVFEIKEENETFIPKKKVSLLLSMIKKENFELACEKATEIGVSEIVPIISERTLAKNLNIDRLKKIVREASEQCRRGDIPQIIETLDLKDVIEKYPQIIAFDILGAKFSAMDDAENSAILIGPEGGWSEKELSMFRAKNISIYKLGETTLRAETAAIVAASKVLI